jgi:hypothetical protein
LFLFPDASDSDYRDRFGLMGRIFTEDKHSYKHLYQFILTEVRTRAERRQIMYYRRTRSGGRSGGFRYGRIIIALIIAGISLFSYFASSVDNPVTGETQHINISVEEEIALGLQAAPEMAAQFGGLDPDSNVQAAVDQIGNHIVQASPASQTP